MTATVTKLPPNPIRHFYRGGPAIAQLRGIDVGGDHSPEEWIGSASTLFGEPERGLSRLPDGGLVRDALAADPEGWLGPAHVERFGASPALLVKLLDAGERLPVHHHPDGPFARKHLGTAFGKTEAWLVIAAQPGALVHVGLREDVSEATLRAWVGDQDHDALLGALNPVEVSAGDAVFVPAGVAHAIGEGILIAELQEPTDLSILLEWEGFGIDDERTATLGLGWDVALASVERAARDASPLRGPRADADGSAVAELLPAAAAPFFSAQRIAPAAGSAQLPAGFAVVIVVDGSGTLGGVDVNRGDALLVPHAAGPVSADGDLVAIACRPPGVPAS
jgi:mannose-6-phosphate isomerase